MPLADRRLFFKTFLGAMGAGIAQGKARLTAGTSGGSGDRQQTATAIRLEMAEAEAALPAATHPVNGDESAVPRYAASFTKGLAHTQLGEVDPSAYESLLHALSTGKHADFEAVARGSGMKLINPQAAYAFELEGADSHRLGIDPPPTLSSAAAAAEMVELYWQALTRDVRFHDYDTSPIAQAALQDLNSLSAFKGPRSGGQVTTGTLFQGTAPGVLDGPYISQFLWKSIPVNSTIVEQKYRVSSAGIDYLTTYPEWFVLQTGVPPYRDPQFDPTPRYITTGRALAEWVHYDFLYQGFHNAALILLNQGPETVLNNNPYLSPLNPYRYSKVQTGFSTFGAPHICSLLGHASMAALHAAWFQKWMVHRRLRPEEFGGRIHQTKTGVATYSIHPELLNSAALRSTLSATGAYLLPQSYPEGCPLHPAYPAGHATVAGACSAMLKAFFDETALITDCVMASPDGQSLMPCDGLALLVGGEINKLAVNIAMGRNFAGIHYRSDAEAGFRLGEEVAMAMLQDMVNTVTEDFEGFRFTRLDGTPVQICRSCAG